MNIFLKVVFSFLSLYSLVGFSQGLDDLKPSPESDLKSEVKSEIIIKEAQTEKKKTAKPKGEKIAPIEPKPKAELKTEAEMITEKQEPPKLWGL